MPSVLKEIILFLEVLLARQSNIYCRHAKGAVPKGTALFFVVFPGGFASPADGSGQPRNPSATAKISSSFCHNFATSFVYFCQYRFDYDVTVLEESIQMGLKRPREANPASTFIIKAHS